MLCCISFHSSPIIQCQKLIACMNVIYPQHLQITEWLKLQGTLRDHPTQSNVTKHTAQDYVQLGTEYLLRWWLCRLLGQPIPVFEHSHRKYPFIMFIMFNFTDFNLCSLLLLLSWLSLIEVYFHLHLSLSVQVFICRIYSVSRYCSKNKDQHGFTYAFSLYTYTHPWKG